MEMQYPVTGCIICQRQCAAGISILGVLICSQCEGELVASKAAQPGYDMYVKRLRALWQRVFDAHAETGSLAGGFPGELMEAVECLEPNTG